MNPVNTKIPKTAPDSLSQARLLLTSLEDHYCSYEQQWQDHQRSRSIRQGIASLFQHWVSYDDQDAHPIHTEFLTKTQALVDELAEALHQCDPDEGSQLAGQAVSLMLSPKPSQGKNDCQWYMMAAEAFCAPLLPFMTSEELARQKAQWLKKTPKRLMLPKQQELLAHMDHILSQMTG